MEYINLVFNLRLSLKLGIAKLMLLIVKLKQQYSCSWKLESVIFKIEVRTFHDFF